MNVYQDINEDGYECWVCGYCESEHYNEEDAEECCPLEKDKGNE